MRSSLRCRSVSTILSQRVGGVPGARATHDGCQAIEAVEVVGGGDALGRLEELGERRGQLLGVLDGAIIDQHAVAVVAVAGRSALGQTIERIVRVGCGAVVEQ
jgi:hypothetical protein